MSHIEQTNFFHTVIKKTCPNVTDIKRIDSCAPNKPIFLAETLKSTPIVFKFVDSRIAMRDRFVSDRLAAKKLPILRIKISGYEAQWYETYKFNPCCTLDEYIKQNLDDDRIIKTYKQVLDVQAQIAESCLDDAGSNTGKYFLDTYKITAPRTRSKILTDVYSIVIKYLSQRHNLRLLHNDLNRKNILCNPDGSLNQIIDITGVSLASEEFAMISLLCHFPLPDASDELIDYYNKITGRKLDRRFIHAGVNLIKQKQRFQEKLRDFKSTISCYRIK